MRKVEGGVEGKGDKALVSRSSNSITKLREALLRRVFSPSFPPFSLFFLSFLISSVKSINRYVIGDIACSSRVVPRRIYTETGDIEKKKIKKETKQKGVILRTPT